MKQYKTKLSSHCFYGNVANILNFYGHQITEAELVLLSQNLCLTYREDQFLPYIGYPNDNCIIGLKQLGYIEQNINNVSELLTSLSNNYPVMVKINSCILDYSTVYNNNTNMDHYIVIINSRENMMEVSDSFIQTIPQSIYQGSIDSNKILNEFAEKKASGIVIHPEMIQDKAIMNIDLQFQINKYIQDNIRNVEGSTRRVLSKYCENIVRCKDEIIENNRLNDIVYQLKFSGVIARLDYLYVLLLSYYNIDNTIINRLMNLKHCWKVIINKLRKCSITKNKDYLLRVVCNDIPAVINYEDEMYLDIENVRRQW